MIVITSLDPISRVAATSGSKMLTTPSHAPRANAICERLLGSVRRACLDHLFLLQEKQLERVLHASVQYCNRARPQQGSNQQLPEQFGEPALQITMLARSTPSQSWVDDTTMSAEVLEF